MGVTITLPASGFAPSAISSELSLSMTPSQLVVFLNRHENEPGEIRISDDHRLGHRRLMQQSSLFLHVLRSESLHDASLAKYINRIFLTYFAIDWLGQGFT